VVYRFRNKYTVRADDVSSGDAFAIKIVAVAHADGVSWAAFWGPSAWSDQRVADSGNVIGEEEATALFNVLAYTDRRYEVQ